MGLVLRELRRRPRVGGQPLRRARPGHHRRPVVERAAPIRSGRPDRAGAALHRRLGPGGRSGLPRWGRHRSQLHAAHGPPLRRRVRGHGAYPSCRPDTRRLRHRLRLSPRRGPPRKERGGGTGPLFPTRFARPPPWRRWPSCWSAPPLWRPRRSTATPTRSCPRLSTAAQTRWNCPHRTSPSWISTARPSVWPTCGAIRWR